MTPVDSPRTTLLRRFGGLVFVATIMLSAGLLFAVEPMFTRMVLPRFGGSASVWSVAIVFFQVMLLMGYLYAHALTRYLAPRLAVLVHLALLFLGMLFLPLGVRAGDLAGSTGGQEWRLILIFTASIGLPFIALSANAPLLQAWYTRSPLPRAHDPYPLYAASNFGSLAALLAYPFLIEPISTLTGQGAAWSMGYVALALLIAACGLGVMGDGGGVTRRQESAAPVSRPDFLKWIALSLVPSAGLVAVTAHLSTDVAAAPFLWVVPLALYLATFIVAFGAGSDRALRWSLIIFPPMLLLLAAVVGFEWRFGLLPDVLLHLIGFWLLALVCHGRLAAARPEAAQLTTFYVAMSLGGALGGVLAALVAPRLFSFVAEYPLVLLLAALAVPRGRWLLAPAVATLILAGWLFPQNVQMRETRRSFFGVHKIEVTRDGQFRLLRHGLEIHGAQQIADATGKPITGKPKPLTYYHEESPLSEAIDAARAKAGGKAISVGVVGLGTGSTACLADPGDRLDYYEIDPEVIRIARDPSQFTFLSGCGVDVRIIEGDARLKLAEEKGGYDILIIDAFSSDSIPAHLLTREAIALFVSRLNPGGMVLMHISNNHLRLQEVVAATGRTLGLKARLFDEMDHNAGPFLYQPTAMVLARADADFGDLDDSDEWIEPDVTTVRPWTDDYGNLFGALLAKLRED